MKIGDRVMTEHGPGTIKDIEFPYNERITRYLVLLDIKPPSHERDVLGYFKNEIQRMPKDNI
jgi:hypothetical protein